MNPVIKNPSEERNQYRFTLEGVNVSIANAIRRTILSDIKTVVIDTEKTVFEINTTRMHNEILKQRLSCIPVFHKDLDDFPDKHVVEIDVKNETESITFITTKDFKIKEKDGSRHLTEDARNQVFPPNPITQTYIDFTCLRPSITSNIQQEQVKCIAGFSIGTAKQNGAYSVVSKCSYENTIDVAQGADRWDALEQGYKEKGMPEDEIHVEKQNFHLLDAQRCFYPNSFTFVVETIGVFTNQEIVRKACIVLQNSFVDFIELLEIDGVPIVQSEYSKEYSTMENSFDLILEDKDYTFGKVLEYVLYAEFFDTTTKESRILDFCGFKKFHPHNKDSIIRIAFNQKMEKNDVKGKIKHACTLASELFTEIHGKIPAR